MAIIETHELTKVFPGDIRAVDGIDFEVNTGEIFAFLGPNGAGKTTTIKMLNTLILPTSGAATVAGLDVVKSASEVRKRIGYVAQDVGVDEHATGKERWVKAYRPTDKGRETFHAAIIETLSVPQPSPRPLMLGLANLPSLSTDEALTALGQYNKELTEKTGLLRTVLESELHSHPYFVNAMLELALKVMQAESEWVEKFTSQIQEQSQTKEE